MLSGTSAESSTAFVASYHRPPAAVLREAPRRERRRRAAPPAVMHTRERWAWFRIGALETCRTWTRGCAELRERFGIQRRTATLRLTSAGRVAWRNLALLVRGGFLTRSSDGYRTTARGRRVLADLRALGLHETERTR